MSLETLGFGVRSLVGQTIFNLRVDSIERESPLVYRVTCLRPHCRGTFLISHANLASLRGPFCQYPGCEVEEQELKRKQQPRKKFPPVKQFDRDKFNLEGSNGYNLYVNRMLTQYPDRTYEVSCMFCKGSWEESHQTLMNFNSEHPVRGFRCRNSSCRKEWEKAVEGLKRTGSR